MEEFLMIFRNEKMEEGEKPSAEQMQAVMKEWQNWIGGIAAQGQFVSTNRLYPEGKSILSNGTILDGPYAEVKEIVGGYVIVKADTLENALEIAKSCPNLRYGGNVEVRSVMSIVQDVNSQEFLNVKEQPK